MDLGNKILNGLVSKDFTVAKNAAENFINSGNCELLFLLDKKSEFLFDFIKEKILKNLKNALNENNSKNIFEFSKIYSLDFREFILYGFSKYSLLAGKNFQSNLNDAQKTYILEFFEKEKIKDLEKLTLAKENINSEFEPLKIAAVKYLAFLDEREDYENQISIIKNSNDELEKLQAVQFLSIYGDKSVFSLLFEYFKSSEFLPFIASNLLLLKNFDELNETEILLILFSFLNSYPEETSFMELNFCFSENILNLLAESQEDIAKILIFYLKQKLNMVLNNKNYLIDLTKNEKEEAEILLSKVNIISTMYDINEVVQNALNCEDVFKNKIAIELIESLDKFPLNEIEKLLYKAKSDEMTLLCAKALFENHSLSNEALHFIKKNVKNDIILQEILNFA